MSTQRSITLEIAITDFCNLKCEFCSQGTPLQKNKKVISLAQLEEYSRLFKPGELREVKISGGEPTLHPEFKEFCQKIKTLFPAPRYILASNGFQIQKHLDVLGVFDLVDVSQYPGANTEVFTQVQALNLPNVGGTIKNNYTEMVDVNLEPNHGKRDIYRHCSLAQIKKVVQDRIYPCCVIFGLSIRRGFDHRQMGALLDENWRENLDAINIEEQCQRCFVNVNAPSASTPQPPTEEELGLKRMRQRMGNMLNRAEAISELELSEANVALSALLDTLDLASRRCLPKKGKVLIAQMPRTLLPLLVCQITDARNDGEDAVAEILEQVYGVVAECQGLAGDAKAPAERVGMIA